MRRLLNKNGQHYSLKQKAVGASTISASTIAAIISLFLAYTNGMPLQTRALIGAGCIIAGLAFVVVMWYTNKRWGIDWPSIIQYIIEVANDVVVPSPKPKPEPEPAPTPTPTPDPIPTPAPVNPAGVEFPVTWNNATVVFIQVDIWTGRVVNDGAQDSRAWYPIVFKLNAQDMLKLCMQGYWEQATNIVHANCDNPFAPPETKLGLDAKIEAADVPLDFLFGWFQKNRIAVDINLEKCRLILTEGVIDDMKKNGSYNDYVNGLPNQQDGSPGGLILAYKNYLSHHDKVDQISVAEALVDKYF